MKLWFRKRQKTAIGYVCTASVRFV